MSKKRVTQAVDLAGRGQLALARQELEGIDPDFVRKRLDLLMAQGGASAEHASILFEYLNSGKVELPPADTSRVPTPYVVGDVAPFTISLDDPGPFLAWLQKKQAKQISIDSIRYIEVWALVALSTLARVEQDDRLHVTMTRTVTASRFAYALGFKDVVEGSPSTRPGESGRTVKLTRISRFDEIEPAASQISHLVIPEHKDEDTRRAIYYVLVELLRNVVQHSWDPLGGVAVAQVGYQPQDKREVIQIAVADTGIGIFAALRGMHPKLTGPHEALEKALWPHFSGAFEEGLTGSGQNAGMGLFFIAEMTKLLAGRLMIATRGATLLLRGDPDDIERHTLTFVPPGDVGFPGTLVAFELPISSVTDYRALIATINDRAKARTPQRAIHKWLRYEQPPEGTQKYVITVGTEDTVEAQQFSHGVLVPALLRRQAVVLDFSNMQICTQSFLHALLFEALRVAWALKTPVFISNAAPAVQSSLELLELYALGG